MRLAILSTIAALSSLGIAQPDPTNIIAGLNSLTTKCQSLMAPAGQLSVLNAPLLLFGAGPWATVITGFNDIATTLDLIASAPPPATKFNGSDAAAITDAFQSYSTAQTSLLGAVVDVGKGVLEPFVVTARNGLKSVLTNVRAGVVAVGKFLSDSVDTVDGGSSSFDPGAIAAALQEEFDNLLTLVFSILP